MQSEPVSPPPMTTTCLPSASDRLDVAERLVADAAVLLRQELHREVDAVELAAGDRQVARLLGAARQHHRVVLCHDVVDRHLVADMDVVVEGHALGFHLRDAPVDVALLHLEVGDAVAQQAAGLGVLLVEVDVVPGARELLRAGQARGARADHGHGLAGLDFRHVGDDPAFFQPLVDDGAFDRLDATPAGR